VASIKGYYRDTLSFIGRAVYVFRTALAQQDDPGTPPRVSRRFLPYFLLRFEAHFPEDLQGLN
jgi:hypothetical protein